MQHTAGKLFMKWAFGNMTPISMPYSKNELPACIYLKHIVALLFLKYDDTV